MAKGFFRVYPDESDPGDIHFEQITLEPSETVPEEQLALRDSVDSTLTTLRLLFKDGSPQQKRYLRPLLSLAQLGLVGTSANPELAQRALASLKAEIVAREGAAIKNGYMKHLGGWAAAFTAVALVAAALLQAADIPYSNGIPYLNLWSGCMAGVWISFGARKVSVEFEDLAILEKDRLSPPIRLVFAGLLTIFIGLLVATGALAIELGSLSAKNFSTDIRVALILGGLCGVSELALSAKVSQHAREMLGLR